MIQRLCTALCTVSKLQIVNQYSVELSLQWTDGIRRTYMWPARSIDDTCQTGGVAGVCDHRWLLSLCDICADHVRSQMLMLTHSGLTHHNKQPYLINSHISRVPSHVLWKLLWLLSGSQGRHGWVSRNWSVSPKFYVIHCGASTHHNILTTVMTSPGNAHTCPGSSPYGSVQNRSSLSGFMRELVCLCNFRNKVVTSC